MGFPSAPHSARLTRHHFPAARLVGLWVAPLGRPAAARADSPPATAAQLAANAPDPAFEQQVLAVIRRHPAVLIEALNAYE
ncbi:MAG: hypothetical protein ACK5Q6_16540, partial [Cyanobacteriota bacterium]